MMLESQLIKHWYFKFIGGFSVKPNSRDALNSIKYCTKLLTDESNLVIIFPQGKINSLYQNKFIFKSGIDKIVENSELDNNIILIVNLIDYLSNKKPNLYIYHKTLNKKDIKGMKIQDLYQNFYNECQDKQKQKTD
jgi:1-acyl-sn-glycerol-3-phosphate acyltransferase